MMTTKSYFNFPISLIPMIWENQKETMMKIAFYAIYKEKVKSFPDGAVSGFQLAADKFNFKLKEDDILTSYQTGKELFEYYDSRPNEPQTGMSTKICRQFYLEENTTDHMKLQLIGFLAARSYMSKTKKVHTLTNRAWYSRMSGFSKGVPDDQQAEFLDTYRTKYQFQKLKHKLEQNWRMVIAKQSARGSIISFALNQEVLNDKAQYGSFKKQAKAAYLKRRE